MTERISLDGIPLELVDTAGLRESFEEVEQLGIARSREALADAALVLVVLDATQPLNDEERGLLAAVEGRPAMVAINKSDLAAMSEVTGDLKEAQDRGGCCAADFGAHRRRHCRAARADSGAGHGRRRIRAGAADQPAPSAGHRRRPLRAGRCRAGERRTGFPTR